MKGLIVSRGVISEISLPKWELKHLQEAVGGSIEAIYCNEKLHYDVFCNMNGKDIGLEPQIALSYEEIVYDLICGDVVVIGFDKEGKTVGLTQNAIDDFLARFKPEALAKNENHDTIALVITDQTLI